MDAPASPDSGTKIIAGRAELDIEYLPADYFEAEELASFLPEVRALLGTKDRCLVRKLRAKSMDRYLAVQGEESAAIELYCNRPRGWSDILTPESYTAIASMGQELNLPFFRDWYARLTATTEAMRPGLSKRVEEAAIGVAKEKALEALQALPSTNSAPSSASDAG